MTVKSDVKAMSSELFILGSASGVPTKNRFCTSIGIRVEGELYLFDCGAPCSTLLYRMGYNPLGLKALFLSHFHADHIADLPLLVQTLQLKRRGERLDIIGPKGVGRKVLKVLELCYLIPEELPFEIRVREVDEGQVYDSGNLKVLFFETSHLKHYQRYLEKYPDIGVNAVGFIIQVKTHRILYTGDVARFDVEPHLAGCDILIHEFGHHSLDDIGRMAGKHGIAKLIVTHIHPDWDEKKSEIEENIRKHYGGRVIVADDGTRITL